MSHLIRITALLLAIAASAVVWYVPLYSGHMSGTNAAGERIERDEHASMPEINGYTRMLIYVSLPVGLCLATLAVPRLKVISASVLLALAILGSMTIGLFYLPAAGVLFIPERRAREPRQDRM